MASTASSTSGTANMMSDRHGDIWALRVQKELLTLTNPTSLSHRDSDNSLSSSSSSMAQSSATAENTAHRVLLPPYCTVVNHHLDIPEGICRVDFAVRVGSGSNTSGSDGVTTILVTLDTSLARRPSTKNPGSTVIDISQPTYPFQGPVCILKEGAEFFPQPQSTIQNGDLMSLDDLDWTPSLHMTDAILNIALKIKESILQKEPFHPLSPPKPLQVASSHPAIADYLYPRLSTTPAAPKVTIPSSPMSKPDQVTASTPQKGDARSSGAARSFLGKAGSALKAMTPKRTKSNNMSPPGTSSESPNKRATPQATPRASGTRNSSRGSPNTPPSSSQPNTGTSTSSASKKGSGGAAAEVRIGEEINLLEEPWVEAHGVYSCKAIRRPMFVEDAITMAEFQQQEKQAQQQSVVGSSMLKSLTQSALTAFEESFLMITETHVIEIKSSKLNLSSGTVTFAIPIEFMAKLKFRRQESLSLFFKAAPDDPLVYMCPDSGDAVHQIQSVLKRYGVKGKHTNAAAHRAISEALQLVQEIQTKELALKHDPTITRVNEIMDLYRQAAERFEVAGDLRHEEVVTHMRKFLALPLTTSILDGSYQLPPGSSPFLSSSPNRVKRDPSAPVPEGEVLERHAAQVAADDTDTGLLSMLTPTKNPSTPGGGSFNIDDLGVFEASIEKMMLDAQKDLAEMQILDEDEDYATDDGTDDTPRPSFATGSKDDFDIGELSDIAADLDAMMKQADDELAELLGA
jgi:hypothetical protein